MNAARPKDDKNGDNHHNDYSKGGSINYDKRTEPQWETFFAALDNDLQSQILSFVNEAELWILSQKSSQFLPAIHQTLASKTAIHFSFLLQAYPHSGEHFFGRGRSSISNEHQLAVSTFLEKIVRQENSNLRYLEMNHLLGLSGSGWLQDLPSSLCELHLEGCARLDPENLIQFLERAPQLRHLNLTGCVRVAQATVSTIANHCPQLQTLDLAGCSQKIDTTSVLLLLSKVTGLKHLNLQGLDNILDLSGQFMAKLPSTMESLNISTCKQLRLAGVEALESIHVHMNHLGRTTPDYWATAPTSRHAHVRHLMLDAVGTPRVGLCRGIVAYFAMGRQLREVHLAGCEQVQDWEIEALAVTCASTLTCIQMKACRIGDAAMRALARYCQVLAEVDISACFRVSNEGIQALSESRRYPPFSDVDARKRIRGSSRLKVLRIGSLPGLTCDGLDFIAKMDGLHVLDVENCIELSCSKLVETVFQLPYLIDINAKSIEDSRPSFQCMLRRAAKTSPASRPMGLRMVNQCFFSWNTKTENSSNSCCAADDNVSTPSPSSYSSLSPSVATLDAGLECCTVRTKVQRLDKSVPRATMYHCIDCHLLPSVDRGICACCVSICHSGHRTYVGSWTRFFCDCPFGVVADNECQALFPAVTKEAVAASVFTS